LEHRPGFSTVPGKHRLVTPIFQGSRQQSAREPIVVSDQNFHTICPLGSWSLATPKDACPWKIPLNISIWLAAKSLKALPIGLEIVGRRLRKPSLGPTRAA
jgi:hypothetical protein